MASINSEQIQKSAIFNPIDLIRRGLATTDMPIEHQEEMARFYADIAMEQTINSRAFVQWLKEHPEHPKDNPWVVFIKGRFIHTKATYQQAIEGLDDIYFCEHIDDVNQVGKILPQ